MAFDSLVRSAVRLADGLTKSLQSDVQHYAWVGQDAFGKPTFEPSTTGAGNALKAIVEPMHKRVKQADGSIIVITAKILVLEEVAPNGTAGRLEPIDPRDRLVLPDGSSNAIVSNPGMMDPTTGRAYFAEIMVGA